MSTDHLRWRYPVSNDLGPFGTSTSGCKRTPQVPIVHRRKAMRITGQERRQLRRRLAIEPVIGHLESNHLMGHCHLKREMSDRLHEVLCAAGYNIKWLLRMIAKKGITFLWRLYLRLCQGLPQTPQCTPTRWKLMTSMFSRPSAPLACA